MSPQLYKYYAYRPFSQAFVDGGGEALGRTHLFIIVRFLGSEFRRFSVSLIFPRFFLPFPPIFLFCSAFASFFPF